MHFLKRQLLEDLNLRSDIVEEDADRLLGAVRQDRIKRTAAGVAAGLIMRMGLPVPDERLELAGRAYDTMSLPEICREAAILDGCPVSTYNRQEWIRSAVSGGSLTKIFTTSVNAVLLAAWDEEGDSTAEWVASTDVDNFKTIERVGVNSDAALHRVPRGDTADHANASDTMESYKIARYARQFTVDEMDIIDDNLAALNDMPREMGQAAKRLRPDLVYSILLANAALNADSVALFDSSTHANLATGGGSALSATSLQTAITAMAKQRRGSGEAAVPINIQPQHLICPQDLSFSAEIILTSAQRIISSNDNGTANPLRGLLQLHTDNRIGVAGVVDPSTGTAYTGTATNWFLASRPGRTIEVAYRRGTGRAPVLRSGPLSQGQWGTWFDVALDIGAKALDYRGLYKSAGA